MAFSDFAKFFRITWASSGDVDPVPDPAQSGGTVSYATGFGFDYERDQTTDTLAKDIDRSQWNQVIKDITGAIGRLQRVAFPDFITADDNNGVPFPYEIHAYIRFNDGTNFDVWESLADNNATSPLTDPTKWRRLLNDTGIKTGMCIPWEGATLPDGAAYGQNTSSGYIWPCGGTVGDASSGATNRAGADTQAYFTQVWTSYSNDVRPIYNSNGTQGSRGSSAAADFAAHKAITVRDMRDVAYAGLSTMGGTNDRGLLTGYREGVNGAVLGATGGQERHTPTIDEMAEHNHSGVLRAATPPAYNSGGTATGNNARNSTGDNRSANTDNSGGGNDFNVVQPTTIGNWILKL